MHSAFVIVRELPEMFLTEKLKRVPGLPGLQTERVTEGLMGELDQSAQMPSR